MSLLSRRSMVGWAATLLAVPQDTEAQVPQRPARIGWITAQQPASLSPYLEALRAGLAEQGYAAGRNITIEYRYGNDDLKAVPSLARELAALPVDLLVSQGAATWEIVKLDLQLPIVYIVSADPVSAGFAESLARPLGNKTGLTLMSFEFAAKRLELLQEMVPNLQKVVVIGNPEHAGSELERAYSEETAHRLDLVIGYLPTPTRTALDTALEAIEREKPQAISLLADGFAIEHRAIIMEAADKLRIPVISGWPAFAQSGALCTYGPRQTESYRRLAYYIARVLNGSRPSDLPIERPTQFELVINLKTARALGLNIPPSVLARADEVID